jgi:putative transposase
MPNSYTCLYYHVIFSTKNRTPQIDPTIQPRLYKYLGGIIRDEKCRLIAAGGTADHVHLLVSAHPQTALSDLLRQAKASSSRWIHQTFDNLADFAWQDGYGAFTVSHSNLENVSQYMAQQEKHHRRTTFQEEFIAFLSRHEIPDDERYVWR